MSKKKESFGTYTQWNITQPLCGIALSVVETAIEKLNEKLTEKSFSRITILLEPVYKNQMEK